MLFNTLAYAGFLALVFLCAWALVERRYSLALPWLGLAGYSLAHPGPLPWALTGVGLLITGYLMHFTKQSLEQAGVSADAPPPQRVALLQLGLQVVALGFLTTRAHGLDPFSYGLAQLGVPVAKLHGGTWLLAIVGVATSYLLLVARKVRLLFILGASYVFYAQWDYRFLPLIWGSSTADWWLAKKISATTDPKRRKRWLLGTVILNLGVLGFFKYFNFGFDTASAALSALGVDTPEVALRVALPVGISFFTFESMSYVIDVYRGELPPQESYAEYLSFVAFFPHLVAGPIVRPRDLLPQLAGPARFNSRELSEGLFLIAVGLGKKIVVGDYLALNLIDRVFDAPLMYSAVETYAATVGYALQIYCDFSGYTDIAIGSALLLGIRFPLNFDSPYKAHNIVDFWRRWHISLSTWLRDYLYIPLGGNRKGPGRTYFNLMATMVLGGLWHGAAWTFVAWGTLHGGALAVNKWWQERFGKSRSATALERSGIQAKLLHGISVLITVHFVLVCWVFFRAETFAKASLIFSRLASGTSHHTNLPSTLLVVLAVGILGHYVPDKWFNRAQKYFIHAPWPVKALALFGAALLLRKMASTDAVPFVYFQF